MSLSEKIIELFTTPAFRYKGLPVNCFGLPVFSPYKKQSVRNAFNRLKQDGYLSRNDGHWLYRASNKKEKKGLKNFVSPFEKRAPKDMILMFDVPETKKSVRNWLRRQLLEFGYVMMQKSVWIGPSPLPKEFTGYMKTLGLSDSVKTFKIAHRGRIK